MIDCARSLQSRCRFASQTSTNVCPVSACLRLMEGGTLLAISCSRHRQNATLGHAGSVNDLEISRERLIDEVNIWRPDLVPFLREEGPSALVRVIRHTHSGSMLSSPHRHARVALAVGTLLASALASVVASAGAVQGAAGAAATRTATSVRGTHASELTPRIAAVAKRALSANPTQGVSSHTVSPSSNVWIPGTFPGGWVNTSSCWSPGNCVAVGSEAYGDNGPPVAFLVVNGVVHTAPAPPISGGFGLQADALSCTSATFCALTNGADDTTAPIDFFNGSSWQVQSTPALLSGVELGNISCSSPTFCVASGWAYSKNSDGSNVAVPQLLTYQGTAWTQATLPALPASTSPDVPTSASCAGSFCMIGPVAQAASGAEWMAVLSGGVWTDSKITSVTPSGTGAYAVGAVACVGAGTCIVSVLPPASSVAGTTLYQSGKWSPLSALADVPAPSEPSLGTPAGVPSLTCLSTT